MIRHVTNKNWANTPLFIILGKIPMLNLPIKCQSSLTEKAIFSDVILVPNYHVCKGKMRNLIKHYLLHIIHKTVKLSHLEELQFIQNINKLMFQIIV